MRKWIVLPVLALTLALFSYRALAEDSGSEKARASDSVLRHHRDLEHSGLYVVPSLSWQAARNLRRDQGFHAEVEGSVYAQPLYWSSPNDGKPMLIVVTERNLIYALDAATGAAVWRTSAGPPVPGSSLPCGNISPLGITSTPVIDERSAAVYLDAMVSAAQGGPPKHMVFALSLRDGSILPGWPVDVEAVLRAQGKTFTARNQNQRGALAIVGDKVYIPYGGHFGDCASYHGWVVGISLYDPSQVLSWSTRARGGGIWAPGGIVSDGQALYVATGNTLGTRGWGDGEAIISLGLDLSYAHEPREFFAPVNWSALDDSDLDLGGANPMLLSVTGAKPLALVLALGKDGKAYLLDRRNLGGIGGSVVAQTVSDESIRTAPAAFPDKSGIYVVFQGSGADCPAGRRGDLTALRIGPGAPPSLTVAWCAREHGRGSPIITTTDGTANPIVWAVGAEGDNRLRGFRGDTGEVVFDGGGSADAIKLVRRFQTLIAAGRHLYVAADHEIYAFTY